MISFFWTNHWWSSAMYEPFSLAAILYSFLFEWTWILMLVLLVYYFATWKKRLLTQTISGILCALGLGTFHFITYLKIYEVLHDRWTSILYSSSLLPKAISSTFGVGIFLSIPLLLIVLAAIVLCMVNLFRRRTFSKKQVLWLTIPLWGSLAVHLFLNFFPGGNNPLIGFQHLLLALLLTLTLVGKSESPSQQQNKFSPCDRAM